MDAPRRTAIMVGVWFVVATGFFAIGQSVYPSILASPDFLQVGGASSTRVVAGVLIELAGVIAIPLTAIFLFPVLRHHSEALALGYVGIRLLEAIPLLLVDGNAFAMLATSDAYVNAAPGDLAHWRAVGSAIQTMSESAFMISVAVVFPIGAMLLNSMLYRTVLVPRLISGWGFVAAAVLLIGSVLSLLGALAALPPVAVEAVLVTPIALQEMVFAAWLIAKGFDPEMMARMRAT